MNNSRHSEATFETVIEAHLKNYRQTALTWPWLAIRQTVSGELVASDRIWQTLSAEFVPALTTGSDVLPWLAEERELLARRPTSKGDEP